MRSWTIWIAIAALALGLLAAGCQQQAQQAETQPAEEAMEMGEEMMEEAGLVDPVCGMAVTEESEFTAEYEGATFYFCSETCRDAFIEEPGKYLEAMGEEVMGT